MKQLKHEAEVKRKAAMQKELERQQAFLQVRPSPPPTWPLRSLLRQLLLKQAHPFADSESS